MLTKGRIRTEPGEFSHDERSDTRVRVTSHIERQLIGVQMERAERGNGCRASYLYGGARLA